MEDGRLKEYLDRCAFINKDGRPASLPRSKHDLNLVLQKRHALLNWQQGSGQDRRRVPSSAKYLLKFRKVRNVIILAPAIATNMTWIPFLSINRERFRIQEQCRPGNVPEGVFLVLSTSMLGKLKGDWQNLSNALPELCLVFDSRTRNQPVVTTYKAHPRCYSAASNTRYSTPERPPQQHRGTVQPV